MSEKSRDENRTTEPKIDENNNRDDPMINSPGKKNREKVKHFNRHGSTFPRGAEKLPGEFPARTSPREKLAFFARRERNFVTDKKEKSYMYNIKYIFQRAEV